jgi:hypothetical protein
LKQDWQLAMPIMQESKGNTFLIVIKGKLEIPYQIRRKNILTYR